MKKNIFTIITFVFTSHLFAQTNTFVPQQMDWGTFLATPSTNHYARTLIAMPNREVIFTYQTLKMKIQRWKVNTLFLQIAINKALMEEVIS